MILVLGGVLFLAPLLSLFADPLPGHDVQRIAQIVLLMLAAGVAAAPRRWLANPRSVACAPAYEGEIVMAVLLGTVVLTGMVSIVLADRPAWALREAGLFLGLCGLAMAIARNTTTGASKRFCWAVLLGIGPYVLFVCCLIGAVLASHETLMRQAIFVGYSNFRFFNHVQTIAIPLLAIVGATAIVPPWARRTAFIVQVASFALVYFSAARASMLGLAVSVVVVAVLIPRQAARWLRHMVAAAMLGAVTYFVSFEGVLRLTHSGVDVSTTALLSNGESINLRQHLWRLALGDLMESPWWGIGPMHFAHRFNGEAAHPHNFLLQLLAEWGLPFTVAILVLAGIALYRLLRAVRTESTGDHATIGAGLTAACAAIAVDAMLSGNFVMPLPQLWIALTGGWLVCWMREATARGERTIRGAGGARSALGVWLIVASQAMLIGLTVPEISSLDHTLAAARTELRSDHFSPRFWSHGWF